MRIKDLAYNSIQDKSCILTQNAIATLTFLCRIGEAGVCHFLFLQIAPPFRPREIFSKKTMHIIQEDPPRCLFDISGATEPPKPADLSIDVGSYGESRLATEGIRRGFVAWWPVGHRQKADVCLWKPPYRPITVQNKTAQWKPQHGYWQIFASSKRGGVSSERNGDKYRRYSEGDFDVIAAYIPTADAFKFWLLKDVAGQLCLSVSDLSTLNNWHVIDEAMKQ